MKARGVAHPARNDATYGVLACWCATEADLPSARRQSHDALLKMLGNLRTGGVEWRTYEGQDAKDALSVLYEDNTSAALSDYYRRLGGLLREHGGCLVVAMAPGREEVRRGG